MRVLFPHQSESTLFDGADAATLATVNVPASIAKFEELWRERVKVVYPGIKTAFTSDSRVIADDGVFSEPAEGARFQELTAVEEGVQRLAEELFDDGNLWMVEAN